MGRYCIICKTLFGCIEGKERHACNDCLDVDSCDYRDHFATSQVTGGICDGCWEKHHELKKSENF